MNFAEFSASVLYWLQSCVNDWLKQDKLEFRGYRTGRYGIICVILRLAVLIQY